MRDFPDQTESPLLGQYVVHNLPIFIAIDAACRVNDPAAGTDLTQRGAEQPPLQRDQLVE